MSAHEAQDDDRIDALEERVDGIEAYLHASITTIRSDIQHIDKMLSAKAREPHAITAIRERFDGMETTRADLKHIENMILNGAPWLRPGNNGCDIYLVNLRGVYMQVVIAKESGTVITVYVARQSMIDGLGQQADAAAHLVESESGN